MYSFSVILSRALPPSHMQPTLNIADEVMIITGNDAVLPAHATMFLQEAIKA